MAYRIVFLLALWFALAWTFFVRPAQAAPIVLDETGCYAYALWAQDIVWARDVGADRAKVGAWLAGVPGAQAPVAQLLRRELERLWATQASPLAVFFLTLQDCAKRGGDYGEAL